MDDLPHLTTQAFIGIVVAISGNMLISLALNLQKLAHKRLDEQKNGQFNEPSRMKISPPNRGRAGGPNFEDIDRTTDNDTPGNPPQETQPLLPVQAPSSADYTNLAEAPSSATDQKAGIFMRIFRSEKHRHKKKQAALLPVDIIGEDAAPHRFESSQSNTDEGGDDQEEDDQANEADYLKSKLWWLGFILMNVGELGNFISYAFAPASVVAPLGTFALIANCVFAPMMQGERFRKRDFLGICVAIVGAVTVVLSSHASDARLNPQQLLEAITQMSFMIYAGCYIVGVIILATLSRGKFGRTYVFVDVGLCSLFGGFTVLSTKALSTLISLKWYGIFTEWITYPLIITLIGTGVGQVRYLNRALMRFDSKAVVPIQFVFFTLSAIIGSAILYGDFRKAGFHEITTFTYGCAATFAGVFILAHDTGNDHEENTGRRTPREGAAEDGTRLGMETMRRRQRATLVLPSGVETPTPSRGRRSSVALVGLSPAQHLLLVHTPRGVPSKPRELGAGFEDGEGEVQTPDSYGRNWALGGFGNDGAWSGSPRSRSSTLRGSNAGRSRGPQKATDSGDPSGS